MGTATKILGLIVQFGPGILDLIKGIEGMFGEKTGPAKKQLAQGMLVQALSQDPNAAELPKEKLEALAGNLIELHLAAAKATGRL